MGWFFCIPRSFMYLLVGVAGFVIAQQLYPDWHRMAEILAAFVVGGFFGLWSFGKGVSEYMDEHPDVFGP